MVMQADNNASKRVAEKCGFVLGATLKKYRVDCLSGHPADDCILCVLTQGDFEIMPLLIRRGSLGQPGGSTHMDQFFFLTSVLLQNLCYNSQSDEG